MSITVFFAIPLLLTVLHNSQSCIHRSFGEDSTVCVCNSTYWDPIPPVEKLEASKYVLYTTSKQGHRLTKSEGSFVTNKRTPLTSITITSTLRQTIFGFGGAFTDSAGYNIKSVSQETGDNIMKSYFGDYGIGYTMGRVPIGATDYGLREYSYTETPDMNLTNFNLAPEDFEYKIPLIKQAMELTENQLKLMGTAWSAPKWMKLIEKYTTMMGLLKMDCYQLWANYHLKFLEAYDEYNITFWSITTGNEPTVPFTPLQIPGVAWSPANLAKWILKNLGPTIRNSKFSDLKIITLDDETVLLPFWLMDMFFFYPKAEQYIDGVGVHWYLDKMTPTAISLESTHRMYPDLFIFGTEGTRGEVPFERNIILGSWTRAEDYALYLIRNLNHWVTGWMDWNLALDCNGGPGLYDAADSPIIVNATSGEFYKQPTYYVMGHFSKFVTPGSKVISTRSLNIFRDSIAFQRPDGGIVLIIANTKSFDDDVTIVDKNKNRGQISLKMKARSVITLLYW